MQVRLFGKNDIWNIRGRLYWLAQYWHQLSSCFCNIFGIFQKGIFGSHLSFNHSLLPKNLLITLSDIASPQLWEGLSWKCDAVRVSGGQKYIFVQSWVQFNPIDLILLFRNRVQAHVIEEFQDGVNLRLRRILSKALF